MFVLDQKFRHCKLFHEIENVFTLYCTVNILNMKANAVYLLANIVRFDSGFRLFGGPKGFCVKDGGDNDPSPGHKAQNESL
jgi:hypothetical protein